MAAALIAALPLVANLLDKVFPDANAAAEAKLKVMELAQRGELAELDADLKLAQGQLEINKIEAADPSLFKSGWRPAAGWVCVSALFYNFILSPLLPWLLTVCGVQAEGMPSLEIEALMTLLFSLLGLGAYRSYEKKNGAA